MRALWVALAAAIAAAGVGCSNDACSQLNIAFQNLQSKTQACPAEQPTGSFNSAACEQQIGNSCTSADQNAIEQAAQCADNLPTCTSAIEGQFEGDEVVCVLGLNSLSPACSNIVAPFVGTGTTGS